MRTPAGVVTGCANCSPPIVDLHRQRYQHVFGDNSFPTQSVLLPSSDATAHSTTKRLSTQLLASSNIIPLVARHLDQSLIRFHDEWRLFASEYTQALEMKPAGLSSIATCGAAHPGTSEGFDGGFAVT